MPRELATLPAGSRVTDYISLGVLAKTFPLDRVQRILAATGTASVRQRALPAHVMVYYVIALALYMQVATRLPDGSYLSRIYPSPKARRHGQGGRPVRVIEYTLDPPAPDGPPVYRLLTTLLDPAAAPAAEVAALYPERWEIETALDEFKTHLRGAHIVLRSKTPGLGLQEFYGLLLAHFAIRGLMHEAARGVDLDPDRLSFVHTVRVVRRTLPRFVAVPPSAVDRAP